MDALIKQLNEDLAKVNSLHKKLEKERREQDLIREQNRLKAEDLNKRAKKIIKLEKKYAFVSDLENLRAKVKEENCKLKNAQALNEQSRKQLKIKENMLEAEHADKMKIANDLVEKYEKAFIKLEAEKKSYKEDIQATINRQLLDRGIRL